MPRSMTGYARVETQTPEFRLLVSVKSVNHRGLEVQMRLPAELEAFEIAARQAIRKSVGRGSLQINASLELRGGAGIRVKRELAAAYLAAWRELAGEHGIAAEPDLGALFRLPGIVSLSEPAETVNTGLEAALLQTLDRALQELARSREQEAAGIVEEMEGRSRQIDEALGRIEAIREGLGRALAQRLAQRLSELLQAIAVDPQRILQEAAFLADKSDISEEVQRLKAHNRQLREHLAAPGEVGKKLDFLAQEMGREANTLLSKTSGLGQEGLQITDLGLAIKAGVEKIREQGMNLE